MKEDGFEIDMKELDPSPWEEIIRTLRASKIRVCFYPGAQDNGSGFGDFVCALAHIGTCNALVFCEPRLTLAQVRQQVDQYRTGAPIPVPRVGVISDIEILTPADMPRDDHRTLFGQLGTEWFPAAEQPADDRYWGLYSTLTLGSREIHLLHVGLAGNAAWAELLQYNRIRPVRIIIASPDRIVANPPYAHGP